MLWYHRMLHSLNLNTSEWTSVCTAVPVHQAVISFNPQSAAITPTQTACIAAPHCSPQLDRIPDFFFFLAVFSNCTLDEVLYISCEKQQMKVSDLSKNRQEFKVLGRSDWYTFPKVRQHGRSPSTPPTARGVSGDLAGTPPRPAPRPPTPPPPPLPWGAAPPQQAPIHHS